MALRLTQEGERITVKDTELGAPNPDPEAEYDLQLLTRKVYKEFEKKHTKKVSNRRTHQMEDQIDSDALGEDLIDYVLQGWRGINAGDDPAPCTREYKLLIDGIRGAAMLERAGLSQVQNTADARERSFRGTPDVR